jgi:autotransporter-associated beta strand protein
MELRAKSKNAADRGGQGARRWLGMAAFALAAAMWAPAFAAGTDITGSVNQSALVCDPTFDGGTLVLDQVNGTTTCNFTVNNFSSNTVDLDGHANTLSGVMSGVGPLTFTNSGIVVLTGNNTYTGGTTISGGTVQLGNGGTTGAIVGAVLDNGTLGFDRSNALSMTGVISGSGSITQFGTGTTTLTAADTFTGTTTISGGTLALTGGGSISSSSSVNDSATFDISGITSGTASIITLTGSGSVVLGGKTLNLTSAGDTFSGDIGSDGTGSLKITDGTETLTGVNGYTGTTTINGTATLVIGSGGDISASSGVVDAGTFDISGAGGNVSITTLSSNGVVTLGGNTLILTSASGIFSGAINGTGGLEISGGTETLSGANTYTGATTIDTGAQLTLNTSTAISSSSGVVLNGTGTLDVSTAGASIKSLSDDASGSGIVNIGSQTLTLTSASGTFTGAINGSGGNLTIHSGTETLSGTNGYSGATTIDGTGHLDLAGSAGNEISASSGVTNNGVFDISGDTSGTVTIKDLSGSSTSSIALGTNDLVLSAATGTYAGVIGGTTGGLHITGGSETLSGANTYAGDTTIDSGTYLHIGGTGSLVDSRVVDNGTFDIAVAGGSTSILSLSGSGSVTLGGNLLTIANANETFAGDCERHRNADGRKHLHRRDDHRFRRDAGAVRLRQHREFERRAGRRHLRYLADIFRRFDQDAVRRRHCRSRRRDADADECQHDLLRRHRRWRHRRWHGRRSYARQHGRD